MNINLRHALVVCFTSLLFLASQGYAQTPPDTLTTQTTPKFSISFASNTLDAPQDGRLVLMLATHDEQEPRFLVNTSAQTQLIFGLNVENWNATSEVTIDQSVLGYPLKDLSAVPPGTYYAQALLNRYKDYNLSNGVTVSLPPDQGEGQRWNRKPGNLYSTPVKIEIKENSDNNFSLTLDQVIAEIAAPVDTKYIKHITMRSELLSEFWGEDVMLGAHVLLPEGFDENPDSQYPLMVFHGHFPDDFGGFRTTPPDPTLEPSYSARFDLDGYNILEQQEAYDLYQAWSGEGFPRFIAIEIQHPTPYYDDSYAVNSASQGPYGDALTYELIPYIEEQFRGIGEGWSRFTYGGSTGGWEAMAVQTFYPDEYNGAFIACPDPIDFRAYLTVNIYDDSNGYFYDSEFQKLPRPGHRDYLGNVHASQYDFNRLEAVLGDKGRSGQQYDIWEATFSPMGDDGYPLRLWDKETGVIDKDVAEYWRENYDLMHILKRDWPTLGPKLEGKLHIYVGDMDNYYLNNAVYLAEEFLESTSNPYYGGVVEYGDRAEHCWNGDHDNGNGVSRLRYNTMYLPRIMERIQQSAPEGADLTSWRY